ncbi:NAD(P)-dependent alcohol dehydrogenase [Fibrivirga algicola]|uniref:NAD(P)-dependent alcohol dehydrogenase n=1 Tax=Fibrivirga algicola TaxID=2950420 RepID=A0ABX0QKP0_9BACT|nr:NAD(P)-dependent alcohol dehydrogenase [Fibrivirga algicola]ARK09859.1 hydroxyacid dehydrogenase [Fibrella sp. ES10-3-2-2]NID11715.1 NAD(P)-dependent alcohol dehydrogenase [Fibrivirga algicola]
MIAAKGYAAQNAETPLAPFQFERRDLKPHDVQFDIQYCGVCHSDLHQIRGEWGNSIFPMVPGHEIVGRVTAVGDQVTKFKAGDLAAVGCFVDSCRHCENCEEGLEQYCLNGNTQTYNGLEQDKKTPTYGGYSNVMVAHQDFVLKISESLDLPAVAPLLCAGITTYSPLRHWKVGKGHKVAVLGLGGLGHMAVKFAVAFGAEVTLLSTSPSKEEDAHRLGAHKFVLTSDAEQVKAVQNSFDFIIDTVSAPHDYNMYLGLLKTNGVQICVGAPPKPAEIAVFGLLGGRKSIVGSNTGGMPETQEMLDFCAEHNIVSDVEVIPMDYIQTAYERMLKGDVRYRFVIDMATL